jgi:hypothetical protein
MRPTGENTFSPSFSFYRNAAGSQSDSAGI